MVSDRGCRRQAASTSSPTFFQDRGSTISFFGWPAKAAIQVHQMQAARPGSTSGRPVRILAERGGLCHVALFQADTVTVFQVNSGDEQHGARTGAYGTDENEFQRREICGTKRRPWAALFRKGGTGWQNIIARWRGKAAPYSPRRRCGAQSGLRGLAK